MIKCTICKNHERDGAKHTCRKCKTKIIYGGMQEPFIEFCEYFKMIEAEKKRQAYYKKINSLPIDDRGHGGKKEILKRTNKKRTFIKNMNKTVEKSYENEIINAEILTFDELLSLFDGMNT